MGHLLAQARGRFSGVTRGWLLLVGLLMLLPATALAATGALEGGADSGLQSCRGQTATMIATPGKELNGSSRRDVIVGSSGADRIEGGGGDDLICAGAGADVVSGGGGDDRILGGAGADLLRGNAGNDRIEGGKGRDRCLGGGGSNELTSCEGAKSHETQRESQMPFVTQENRVPLAKDVATSTDEDTPESIAVAELASDGDGDPLSIASVDSSETAGTVAISDSGSALRFDPAGRFDALAPGENAEDSFRYTVTDGRGGAASAKVTISVSGIDDPPQAVDDQASLQEGASASALAVLGNDTDVDGGPKLVTSVTPPVHGTAGVGSEGLDVSYQPNPGYCNDGEAPDSFTYTLNGGSTATVAVAVTCVSDVLANQGGLFTAFDPNVHDYTVKCTGAPLEVSGRLAQGSSISVDGGADQTGAFAASVPLTENQEFSFSLDDGTAMNEYHVRCLPANFPTWEYEGLRTSSHDFYIVTPTLGAGAARYAVIFDNHGVPVWWDTEDPAAPSDAKVLANGTVAWWSSTAPHGDDYEIHGLDGTLLKNFYAATGRTDSHEFQETPNGNFLLISYQPREHVDLTPYGGGADDTVTDAVIEELNPHNEPVWSWSTQGHIGLAETGRWWPTALASDPRDIVHMNAVEPDGNNAILISLRHTDAVYKIDKTTGEVVWKLGGTWTPKSLKVVNDPQGAYPLGGQHDVRLQPDGTITIHDNDTNLPSPPRAVRYEINEATHTATLVEQITDPKAPSSFCCGSARRSADGSWLMSWGGNSLVTEFNPAGERTFRLGFGGVAFSYRAVAAPEGALSAAALRAGMDAMHPRTP
jgi:VCBS repeat-containing protein